MLKIQLIAKDRDEKLKRLHLAMTGYALMQDWLCPSCGTTNTSDQYTVVFPRCAHCGCLYDWNQLFLPTSPVKIWNDQAIPTRVGISIIPFLSGGFLGASVFKGEQYIFNALFPNACDKATLQFAVERYWREYRNLLESQSVKRI